MERKRILLPVSGRGVEYKVLSPNELDKVESAAAAEMISSSSMLDLRNATAKLGCYSMITSVTKQAGLGKEDFITSEWRKMTAQEVEEESGVLFISKEVRILRRIFEKEHVITENEVEDIMGKAIAVAD